MHTYQRAIFPQQKQEKQFAILQNAQILFEQSSYDAINMIDIARQVGIAKGTLYLYFKSKESLFLGLFLKINNEWFEELNKKLSMAPGPLNLETFVVYIESSLENHPLLQRLISIPHLILEQNIEYSEAYFFKHHLRDHFEQTGILVENVLPFLKPGDGMELLFTVYVILIGLQHISDTLPGIQPVYHQPELNYLRYNPAIKLKHILVILLKGMEINSQYES